LHKALADETAAVMRRSNEEKNPGILLDYLKEWWLDHINLKDKKYILTLKQYFKLEGQAVI